MEAREMVSFIAHTDGKVIVPDEPVELEDGQRFRVTIEPVPEDAATEAEMPDWVRMAVELSKLMPDDLPEDLAEQHDHYIHGTPKR
jgi:hypothetical protein